MKHRVFLLLCTALIAACGKTSDKPASKGASGVSLLTLQNPFFKVIGDNITAEAARSGYEALVVRADNFGGGARVKGFKATEDMLQAHPDLVGIFAINDPSAFGARGALEKAGKADKVMIIGFDGQTEGKQAIKDGKIYADPVQLPEKMGVEVVRAFIRYSKGEELPPQMLIPTSLYRKADGAAAASLK